MRHSPIFHVVLCVIGWNAARQNMEIRPADIPARTLVPHTIRWEEKSQARRVFFRRTKRKREVR